MTFEYEGCDIAPLVNMVRCVHDVREEGRVPRLIAEFEDPRGLWDSWGPTPGDRVSVSSRGAAATGALYVSECKPIAGGYEIRAEALPVPDVPAIRVWRSTMFCVVASQIAAALSLGVKFHGVANMAFEYVKQDSEGALPVLARLCALAGCTFDIYDGVLHVCGRDWVESQDSVGSVSIEEDSDYGYTRRKEYTRCTIEQTQIAGIRSGIVAASGTAGHELAVELDDRVGVPGTYELERACAGVLACANARRSSGYASSSSLSALSPGSVCDLTCDKAPSLNGTVVITRVRNDFVNGRSKIWWR